MPTEQVNHPAHYTSGGIEVIAYLRAKLTPEEFAGFCKGNALKYLSRAGHKGDATEDLRKAAWYMEALIAATEESVPPDSLTNVQGFIPAGDPRSSVDPQYRTEG